MSKFMHGLGVLLAGVCAVLFVFTAALALMLFNLERRMFNAQVYTRALEDQNLYDRLPAVAAEAIVASLSNNPCPVNPVACNLEGQPPALVTCLSDRLGSEIYRTLVGNRRDPNASELEAIRGCYAETGVPLPSESGGGPPGYMQNLTADNWEAIIRAILPPEELRALTEDVFTQLFGVINGQRDQAVISLAGLKERLSGEQGYRALVELMRAQPPCTGEQIDQLRAGDPQNTILCNPSAEQLALVEPNLYAGLAASAARIPDTAPLLPGPGNSQFSFPGLSLARFVMRLSLLIPLGLLLAITLFTVRTLKGWLRWWGIPLLLAGLLGVILALLLQPLFQFAFVRGMAQAFPLYLPQGLLEVGAGLLGSLLHALLEPFALQSLILGLIGLGLWIGSFFVRSETPSVRY